MQGKCIKSSRFSGPEGRRIVAGGASRRETIARTTEPHEGRRSSNGGVPSPLSGLHLHGPLAGGFASLHPRLPSIAPLGLEVTSQRQMQLPCDPMSLLFPCNPRIPEIPFCLFMPPISAGSLP